jgi:hypothetical protein
MIRLLYKTILLFFSVFFLLSCQNKKEESAFIFNRSTLPEVHSNLPEEPTACDCLKEMDQLLDALLIIQADFQYLKTQYEKETNQAVKNQLGDYLIDLDKSSKPYKDQLIGIEEKCSFSDNAFESCGFFEKIKEKFGQLKP